MIITDVHDGTSKNRIADYLLVRVQQVRDLRNEEGIHPKITAQIFNADDIAIHANLFRFASPESGSVCRCASGRAGTVKEDRPWMPLCGKWVFLDRY